MMATLTTAEYHALKNSADRGFRIRFWLFDAIDYTGPAEYTSGYSMATTMKPATLISPPYSLVKPGQSVTLYGGDSYERGATATTGHSWSVESGSAILAPSGTECVVTPTGGEDSTVVVKLTTTATNSQTSDRYAYIACSTDGWAKPCGSLRLDGAFDMGGWSGTAEVLGDSVEDLEEEQILLVHVDTYYDGVKRNIGGYKRAQNLCVLQVKNFNYYEDHDGVMRCRINLASPAALLGYIRNYAPQPELDNDEGPIRFDKTDGDGCGGLRYLSDFRISDAALDLLTQVEASEHFNCTVFHEPDANEMDNIDVMPGALWDQLNDLAKTVFCVFYCNYTGSLMWIPSPSIRADEWWGTPDPIWDDGADGALTDDFCLNYEIRQRPGWQELGGPVRYLTLKGYDADQYPVMVRVTSTEAKGVIHETLDGYALPSYAIAEVWAADYYCMVNRNWDLKLTLAMPGNVFQLGSFIDVDFDPQQTGQSAATGQGYVNGVRHDIDLDAGMWRTTVHLVEVTAS